MKDTFADIFFSEAKNQNKIKILECHCYFIKTCKKRLKFVTLLRSFVYFYMN